MIEILSAAFITGLFGSAHCIGMCGGISAALGASGADGARALPALRRSVTYNLGRIASYSTAGAIVGAIGAGVGMALDVTLWAAVLRGLAAAVVIAIGLQLLFGWRLLTPVENAGMGLWRHMAPLARRLMPVRSTPAALALGALWGWLPCGLVYAMLLTASVAGGAESGAAVMAAFGAGTLPALLVTGTLGGQLRRLTANPRLRRGGGAAVVVLGAWTLVTPAMLGAMGLPGLSHLCSPLAG